MVNIAVDITKEKVERLRNEAENERLVTTLEAISASQAMIEFETDGTILTANANFLAGIGYSLDEIQGKHHSTFVDAAHKDRPNDGQFRTSREGGRPDLIPRPRPSCRLPPRK